jgi:fructose-specific component phosphotransferase system IIB-like protein
VGAVALACLTAVAEAVWLRWAMAAAARRAYVSCVTEDTDMFTFFHYVIRCNDYLDGAAVWI